MASLILENVDVWNSGELKASQDIEIEGGMISRMVPHQSTPFSLNRSVVKLSGLTLLPLGVDPQVHLRVPGQAEKETSKTCLLAARRSGIGALLTMPNTKPVIDNIEVLERAKAELEPLEHKFGVKVFFSAAISMGQKGIEPVDFHTLAKAGVRAFTDDGLGVAQGAIMEAALRASEELQIPILQHAENPGHGGVLAPSAFQRKHGIAEYPEEHEWKMVERDIEILRKYPQARYHVLHISSAKTVELIRKAKSEGLRITGEASPHHLWFSCEDISEHNKAFKMNPPLRTSFDRQTLREALCDGTLDFLATDHAPHERAAKDVAYEKAAFGTTCLEASFKVLLELVHLKMMTPQRLVEVFSTRAAAFLGADEFGEIKEGKKALGLIVDTHAEKRPLALSDLAGKSTNSCFLGAPLRGSLVGRVTTQGFEWL